VASIEMLNNIDDVMFTVNSLLNNRNGKIHFNLIRIGQ